jgi:hypothetical protein
MRRCLLIAPLLALVLLGGFYATLQAAPAPLVAAGRTTPINISNSDHARRPDIAQATDGTIYVTWEDDRLVNIYNIFITSSTNGGKTWSSPLPVASSNSHSGNSSLVISGTLPRVAWSDWFGDINPLHFQIYQADVGGEPALAIPTTHHELAVSPSLAASPNGDLHMAFSGRRDGTSESPSILHTCRAAGASTWNTATVAYSAIGVALYPSLATDPSGNVLHMVWSQDFGTDRRVMYMTGTVSLCSVTWSEPLILSTDTHVWRPTIAVAANGDIHVVWSERVGGRTDIYLHYNRRIGGSWQGTVDIGGGAAYEVNDNNPSALKPVVAVSADSNTVCVVWNAYPAVSATAEDIFITCSEDRGQTWSARENISQSFSTISINPSLLIDADEQVHVVWQEQTGSDINDEYQIFYARRLGHSVFMPLLLRQAR